MSTEYDDLDDAEPEWVRLALGQCTAEEMAELRARDRDRYELYRPLSTEQKERIWERVEQQRKDQERERALVTQRRLVNALLWSAGSQVGYVCGTLTAGHLEVTTVLASALFVVGVVAVSAAIMLRLHGRLWVRA